MKNYFPDCTLKTGTQTQCLRLTFSASVRTGSRYYDSTTLDRIVKIQSMTVGSIPDW